MKKVIILFFILFIGSIILTNISFAQNNENKSVTEIQFNNTSKNNYQIFVTAMIYNNQKAETYESSEIETKINPGEKVNLKMYRNLMSNDIDIVTDNSSSAQ